MNPFILLFGFSGRINRGRFWIGAAAITLVLVSIFTLGLATDPSAIKRGVFLLICIVAVISAICIGIKRLHDRNKSSAWLVLFYGAPLLALVLDFFLEGLSNSFLIQILQYLILAILIWALVELGCLRGSIGANQYGGDPLTPQPAPPRTLVR